MFQVQGAQLREDPRGRALGQFELLRLLEAVRNLPCDACIRSAEAPRVYGWTVGRSVGDCIGR